MQVLGIVALCWIVTTSAAQGQSSTIVPDSVAQGYGLSYWGEIPPPSDSTSAPGRNRSMPVWEGILVWPYRVIAFPFRLVADGVGATIAAVDESPFLRTLVSFHPGPFTISPELNVGGLSGFGFGIAVQRHSPSDPRQQLRFRLSGSTQQDYRATLGARFPTGQRGGLTLGAGLRDHANTRYFGIGPESTGEEESLYREIQTWVGATYGHRLARSFALEAGFEFSSARAEEPVGDFRPSITERFAGSLPPGFDATSTGLLGRFTIEHDNTDGTGRPNHGGRWVAQAGYFHSLQDQWASHWTIRLEAQQFTRLWFPHTVLALRGVLTWLEPVGDAPIPFQRLLHNNDPDLLRGYQDRRWRDKGLLLLSAEYRWPVWAYGRAEGTGLDCYILTDIGQVFPTLSAIRTSDFTVSYGGGIRLVGGAGFMLRLEYARSTQGGLFRLQTQQTFQFTRGLFHGRDAVPAR